MKRQWQICPIVILLTLSTGLAKDDYWQQFVHYSLAVTLLPGERALSGTETIEYQNNSPDTLRKFYLHLYPDA
ncbi:MAG: M1 family peptidase, partial [bacterium]